MRRRSRLEARMTIEASLPRPGSPATAAENPEEDDEEEEGETPHAAPCRQPDDFSTTPPASFGASAEPFGALACSRFFSHSSSASFISRHHLKWWL